MKLSAAMFAVVLLFVGKLEGFSQGFVNLNFENATLIPYPPSAGSYTATIPGWAINPHYYWNESEYPTISIPFNGFALDAPAVTLQGTSGALSYTKAIQGGYSILLQGGTFSGGMVYGQTNGATISQTGQIPLTSRSITYLGGSLQVAFNGNPLSTIAISNTPNYTVWGADISAYAGQTGELRFTSPWQSIGMLDGIRFSTVVIPEPSVFALSMVGGLLLALRQNKDTQDLRRDQTTTGT